MKNAIKVLYLFFKKDQANKSNFYQRYVLNGLDEDLEKDLDIKLKRKIIEKKNFRRIWKTHHYLPLLLSTREKIDYIKHIIKTKSEVKSIEDLERFLEENGKLDVDWWLFSKIDEYLDEVFIPYYDPETNFANLNQTSYFGFLMGKNILSYLWIPKELNIQSLSYTQPCYTQPC